jgi:hypothetical protein
MLQHLFFFNVKPVRVEVIPETKICILNVSSCGHHVTVWHGTPLKSPAQSRSNDGGTCRNLSP